MKKIFQNLFQWKRRTGNIYTNQREKEIFVTSFEDVLNKINTAAEIAAAAEPTLSLFSQDHQTATQELLQLAGAGVASISTNSGIQTEAAEAATLASSLVPLVFKLFSLFHKPASQQTGTPGAASPASGAIA